MGRATVDGYCDTLDALIVALCADFPRRAEAVLQNRSERRTLMEYRYVNFKMYEGAAEIVGERLAVTSAVRSCRSVLTVHNV